MEGIRVLSCLLVVLAMFLYCYWTGEFLRDAAKCISQRLGVRRTPEVRQETDAFWVWIQALQGVYGDARHCLEAAESDDEEWAAQERNRLSVSIATADKAFMAWVATRKGGR